MPAKWRRTRLRSRRNLISSRYKQINSEVCIYYYNIGSDGILTPLVDFMTGMRITWHSAIVGTSACAVYVHMYNCNFRCHANNAECACPMVTRWNNQFNLHHVEEVVGVFLVHGCGFVGKWFDDGRSPLLVQWLSENFPDFTPN